MAVSPIGAVNTANPGGGIEGVQGGARRPVHDDISDAGLDMDRAAPAGEERQLTHAASDRTVRFHMRENTRRRRREFNEMQWKGNAPSAIRG